MKETPQGRAARLLRRNEPRGPLTRRAGWRRRGDARTRAARGRILPPAGRAGRRVAAEAAPGGPLGLSGSFQKPLLRAGRPLSSRQPPGSRMNSAAQIYYEWGVWSPKSLLPRGKTRLPLATGWGRAPAPRGRSPHRAQRPWKKPLSDPGAEWSSEMLSDRLRSHSRPGCAWAPKAIRSSRCCVASTQLGSQPQPPKARFRKRE